MNLVREPRGLARKGQQGREVRRFQDSPRRRRNVLRHSGTRQGGSDDSDGATGENAEQGSQPYAVGVQKIFSSQLLCWLSRQP